MSFEALIPAGFENKSRVFHMPLDFDNDENEMTYLASPKLEGVNRIAFLDIDGVLNAELHPDNSKRVVETTWKCSFDSGKSNRQNYGIFDLDSNSKSPELYLGIFPDLVAVLNRLHETYPDLRYVLSSTWRSHYRGTIQYLKEQGFTGQIIDRTKSKRFGRYSERYMEIADWLAVRNYHGKYIAIDDDESCQELNPYWIQTIEDVGITECNVDKAIKLLE